jgi:hypothetical protein
LADIARAGRAKSSRAADSRHGGQKLEGLFNGKKEIQSCIEVPFPNENEDFFDVAFGLFVPIDVAHRAYASC